MWEEIQDMQGEIFDIEPALEQIKQERLAREEEEEFLDLCNDLLMEGFIDEDAIEEEAHRLLDEMDRN